uniref:Uncharacterized protein n=1 Tax=Siphoviridae sp. ct7Qv4 TaxID=2827786 RepID=A0A8S5SMY1_9CAUD|nr:MAG TPA: hypothetical protein [Siphoviridae sp. ct7Qv4]
MEKNPHEQGFNGLPSLKYEALFFEIFVLNFGLT